MKKTLLLILTSLVFLAGCSKNEENLVPDDETPGDLTFITRDSPVGTIGMLDGVEGIVVELPAIEEGYGINRGFGKSAHPSKKVVIATKNIDADAPDACGNYLVRDEKQSCNKNGWYIPSLAELYALFNISEKEWTGKGYKWLFDDTNTSFFMPVTGRFIKRNVGENFHLVEANMGYYWASNEEDCAGEIRMNAFRFSELGYETDMIVRGQYYDDIKNVVRLFHAMPE